VVLLVLSRTGKILQFLGQLRPGEILTLRPLLECPQWARYIVTLAFGALVFLTVWTLINRRK